MELASLTLPLSSSIPFLRPSSSLPLSSSRSVFFATASSLSLKSQIRTRANSERLRKGLSCNALFGLGVPELVVIAGVAALVFGPKKLPEIGKSVGKTVKSFQQAAKEFESELKKEPDLIGETPETKSTTAVSSEEEEKQGKVSTPNSKEEKTEECMK